MWRSESRRLSFGIVFGILCSAVEAVELRIVEPAPDEILYGRTSVVVRVTAPAAVGQVVFYLDPLERPICGISKAPFRCEFDSGKDSGAGLNLFIGFKPSPRPGSQIYLEGRWTFVDSETIFRVAMGVTFPL